MRATMHLRILRDYDYPNDNTRVEVDVIEQWWSTDGSGPDAPQGESHVDPSNTTTAYVTMCRAGEWRELPVVRKP